MRDKTHRSPEQEALFRRIINPGKADGRAMTVAEVSPQDWPMVQALIMGGDITIMHETGTRHYVQPTATVSEAKEAGYLDAE